VVRKPQGPPRDVRLTLLLEDDPRDEKRFLSYKDSEFYVAERIVIGSPADLAEGNDTILEIAP
jgi:hypothetical protein